MWHVPPLKYGTPHYLRGFGFEIFIMGNLKYIQKQRRGKMNPVVHYKIWSQITILIVCTSLCNYSLNQPAIRGLTCFSTLLSATNITRKK